MQFKDIPLSSYLLDPNSTPYANIYWDFKGSPMTVYKIYKGLDPIILRAKEYKIRYGISHPIPDVTTPTDIIYDDKKLAGYQMLPASGIAADDFYNPGFLFDLKDALVTMYTLEKKITSLLSEGIVVADVTLSNVFVTSPEQITLIDYDDFQIHDFPCEKRNVLFDCLGDFIYQEKYYQDGLYTKQLHSLSIAAVLFSAITDFKLFALSSENAIMLTLKAFGLTHPDFMRKFITLFDLTKENEPFGETLLEMAEDYILDEGKYGLTLIPRKSFK